MNRRTALAALAAVALLLVGVALGSWLAGSPPPPPDPPQAARGKAKSKKKARPVAPPPGERMPNVLIVVWDTVRADRMSLYGHGSPTTPGLERFAKSARVFEHAIAPGTWTVPSHASLFTGLPVSTHGANASWRWVDNHHVTLAEHLSANGYATYAYSANPYVSGMTNMLQGFDVKRYSWEEDKVAAAAAFREKLLPSDASTEVSPAYAKRDPNVAWSHAVYKEASGLAHERLTTWLANRPDKDRPWFAFVNLMEAHSPRIPSMEARKAVVSDTATLNRGLKTDVSLWTEVSAILGQHRYSDDDLRAVRGVYDATLVELDRAFTALIAELEAKGALDRTIVILTSDHGESLGEHGLWEHRYGVWNTLVHVPLIIRYPRGLEPGRVDEPVSTAAVYPTVLDLLGLPPPEGLILPRSLRRKKQNLPVYTQLTDPYTSKLGPFRKRYSDLDFTPFLRTFDAMIDGRVKIVHASDGAHELYDLVDDPEEQANLFARHPEAETWIRKLESWRARVPKADPAKRNAADLKKGRGSKTERKAMKQMLEQLGYVEDDEGADDEEDPMGAP
ncbi:MAG: sulfatase [Alphaproteobacteria bacterium]|nr:sulfatase [Alphaproteobacteria bacterium]